jgi:Rad3-related DNA helicase
VGKKPEKPQGCFLMGFDPETHQKTTPRTLRTHNAAKNKPKKPEGGLVSIPKRIKKLFDYDKIWYINAMLNNLVQMCGRCTRSEDDFSETYILDGNIVDILLRNSKKLPKYFIERVN